MHLCERLAAMTEQERELFARALNTLFTSTFIIKRIDSDRDLYRFAMANYSLFEEYLSFADWHVRKDEHSGVISCSGPSSGRLQLNLDETLSLLVFRLLYEEKQHEINLSMDTIVRQYEFHERFKVLTERMLNKTRMRDILHRFRQFKLIDVRGDETDPETILVLYPSLAFVLDSESIDTVYDRIAQLTGTEQQDRDSTDGDADRESEEKTAGEAEESVQNSRKQGANNGETENNGGTNDEE